MAGISHESDRTWLNRVDAVTVISFGFHVPASLEGIGNVIKIDLREACRKILEAVEGDLALAGESYLADFDSTG